MSIIAPAAATLTTTAIVTAVAVSPFPDWSVPPLLYEVIATLVLGVIATWTREIVRHYDDESAHVTSIKRCIVMIIPGIFAGFLGGEISSMAGFNPSDARDPSWLFVLVIGYIGPPAMNMLCSLVLGIMSKTLERWGLDVEKQQAARMKEEARDQQRATEVSEREYQQAKELDIKMHEAQMKELQASLNEPS